MQSIFRYPGGKSKKSIQELILSHSPGEYFSNIEKYKEYREPFVGGGGIFFSISPKIKRWINDINHNLMEVYTALKDRPEDFINKCREILPAQEWEEEVYPKSTSSGKKYNARLKEKFDYFSFNTTCDQALRYFFVNRTVWAGRVNYDQPSRMYFSNPEGWNITQKNTLELASQYIKGTKITCTHYKELLQEPGENVWIYCDPPYMKDTDLNLQSKLYAYGFSEDEHIEFAKHAKECKHNLLISYDEHPFILKLFKDFYIKPVQWTYCGTSNEKKEIGKELLISNYKLS